MSLSKTAENLKYKIDNVQRQFGSEVEKTKEKVEWVETQVVDTQIELNEAKYQFGEQKERLDDAEKKMKVSLFSTKLTFSIKNVWKSDFLTKNDQKVPILLKFQIFIEKPKYGFFEIFDFLRKIVDGGYVDFNDFGYFQHGILI